MMAKTSKSTKEEKPTAVKEKKARENEKNFILSDEALRLVLEVRENRGNMSEFASRCIAEYGPFILEETGDFSGEKAPFAPRFRYLEEIVVAWAYDEIVDEDDGWDAATIKAHQDVLKSTGKKSWYNAKSITAIMDVAAENPETEDTEPYQWQTLLRRRKDFLALKRK
ncbi:hypothetical protein KL86DPRO_11674 [uncultured delta proteobacterium]|uniref:Uncharacterized protein n=1 Tax=uncultured delta proteobacterium TaxID=34034 RepID=A0A212JK62_9DELT|nr:hypothetical protein KL86DPRO_11674 [uncultured delta proteobacterium]